MARKKAKVVMVFGTFDGLHPGHVSFLKQASRYGASLVAVVARDATVRKEKGRAPHRTLSARMSALGALGLADRVLAGDPPSRIPRFPVIAKIKPLIICLGYDQERYLDKLASVMRGWKRPPRIVRLKPHQSHRYKSSLLRTRES